MLNPVQPKLDQEVEDPAEAGFDVEVLSVATATSKFQVTQSEITERVRAATPHLESLWSLYGNTGIKTRYLCEPTQWYLEQHGWEERTRLFQRHALDLLEEVTVKIVAEAGISLQSIDMIVTNTITGLAIPSLDAKLVNRLNLPATIERLPIFGLGCGGGVAGLARATRLAHSMPGSHVLFLTVDLCSLCLRINDPSPAMFVSGALFGDGAAGVLLHNTQGSSQQPGSPVRRIRAIGEYFWRETEHIMGWDVKEDGFGVVLSPDLPALMQKALASVVHGFLDRHGMSLENFKGLLFHPGGRKLLEIVERELDVDRQKLAHSWEVLRQYGNMSSATALFVLERALRVGTPGPYLLGAFGPGFSAYFVAVDL